MIKLQSDAAPRERRLPSSRLLSTLALMLLLVLAGLLGERWRGRWGVSRWKRQMAAQGEVFEAQRLWPRPSARGLIFSNQLQGAVAALPARLNTYAGLISGIVMREPGSWRRGSQEPIPTPVHQGIQPGTWQDLGEQIRQARPALQTLQSILKSPPADMGEEILPRMEKLRIPNFVNVRRAAQALQAATLSDLNRGDLSAAKDDLVALAAFTRLYNQDPSLVNFMIRIAVLGLSVDAAWDALQAEGWTDAQLSELEQAFQCDEMWSQMPRTMEAERASRVFELSWFSSHSYLAWVDRYQAVNESLGQKNAAAPAVLATRYYRELAFHPLWRFAWADQEQLDYLQSAQRELDCLREAAKIGSWKLLRRRLDSVQQDYRRPLASWRLYLVLPLRDQMSEVIGGSEDRHGYPYPSFNHAWLISMKHLTLCQMLTAAISLKRYEMKHGKPAPDLQALVPEFSAKVPRDFMNGQPLRYYLRKNGSYCLYSVGDDAQDDQGSPVPRVDEHQGSSVWNGRDWVWPGLLD